MGKGTFIRPFLVVSMLLAIGWHWTGGPIITFYTIDIIRGVNIPMDPYLCAFIISGYQLFMAIISTIVSSIIPRRKLFLVCGALEVIGNLILASMVYFNRQEYFSDVRRDPHMIPHVMAKSAARARRRLGLCSHINPVF